MGNYWLITNEINELIFMLSTTFEPHKNSYFTSSHELLDTMTDVQNAFIFKNPSYAKYIHLVKITFVSTKFKKDSQEIWRFDDYMIESLY